MSEPTIAIIGGTVYGNRGAEAMLSTTIAQVFSRYPNAKIKVYSYYPEKDTQLVDDSRVEILNYRPLHLALALVPLSLIGLNFTNEIKTLKNCNLVLDIAGISFNDGRLIFLLYNVFSLLPPLLLKVPTVKLAQALGPFEKAINKIVAGKVLSKLDKIYARGPITLEYLKSLKTLGSKIELSSDIAFQYKESDSLTKENLDKVNSIVKELKLNSQTKKIAGIIPSSLLDSNDPQYLLTLLKIIDHFISQDYLVVLIPNATRELSQKARNNDIYTIKRLLSKNPNQANLLAVDYDVSTLGTRMIIENVDFVITSRFHGMISSLALEKPTMVIGWSHKYLEILKTFDIDKYAVNMQMPIEEIMQVLGNFEGDLEKTRDKVKKNLPKILSLSGQQFRCLDKL